MKQRFCRWLFRHKMYRLCEKVSPSIYWALVFERAAESIRAGFAAAAEELSRRFAGVAQSFLEALEKINEEVRACDCAAGLDMHGDCDRE